MSEEQLNKMLENIENAFWYLKNCKCNVNVTTKGHKWETYCGLDDDLIKYIRKIENQLQQKENIIKEVREYIKELLEYKNTNNVIHKDFVERIIDIINQDKRY